ncbi:hypothetical protein QC762_0044340 [Podospora pseudocomata]|uniref:Uncharacterized protein n=1 Tax=Podospora pseudocomata TaxID=2093779 RepID=A0ABR0GNE7_9PEZI|nr:hypothetical protein QC762_0044340 [Podospora pseudocomata]
MFRISSRSRPRPHSEQP